MARQTTDRLKFNKPLGALPELQLAGDAPRGLGRALAGGGDKVRRQANDYYPTPAEVTRAFLRVERAALGAGPVWECCGRGGAIVRELAAAGLSCVASDLVPDPAHGVVQQDVLRTDTAMAQLVVTNPPFALAAEIISHLLARLRVPYLALLVKAQFWHAEERRALFERFPPARIWALTWRPDFMGLGAPTMDCIWTVWDARAPAGTRYALLPRDGGVQGVML